MVNRNMDKMNMQRDMRGKNSTCSRGVDSMDCRNNARREDVSDLGGCNRCGDKDRDRCGSDCKYIMEHLRKVDFAITDAVLYLDMHPNCKKGREYYDGLIAERRSLVCALAERCRTPVSFYDVAGEGWDWTDSPWPWDASAN